MLCGLAQNNLSFLLVNRGFSLSIIAWFPRKATLLETRTMEYVFSNSVGLPTFDDPTPCWFNSLNLPRSEKDILLQSLFEQKSKTEVQLLPIHEYKPQSGPVRRNCRSSKSHIPRDGIDPERARHLERNRVAASKCRLKKKKEHLQLQAILDGETAKRETLLAEVDALRKEIWRIKNQVFEHAGKCDSQKTSLQLAMMARNKLLGADLGAMHCPHVFG